MIYTDFAQLVRYYTWTDSVTLPNSTLVLIANKEKNNFAVEIAKINEDYFWMVFKRNLVAWKRDYPMPAELLNSIKRLEVDLDGTWYLVAGEVNISMFDFSTSESEIQAQFNWLNPRYGIYWESLWIYSWVAITDISDWLMLYAISYPQDITTENITSTEDISTPKDDYSFWLQKQFHDLLAIKTSITYKTNLDKPKPLSKDELEFQVNFEKALSALKKPNQDRVFTGTIPYLDGTEY